MRFFCPVGAYDFVIKSRRVIVDGRAEPAPACVAVRDGKIDALLPHAQDILHSPVHDVGNLVVMPGLVDTHVHVNEPGRTEWEGFRTATQAAAAGGITTLVDMPLNSIPATTSLQAFYAKLSEARNRVYVDTAFWGGVVPGNASELEPMVRAGVVGFKCFLTESGVDEFKRVCEADLQVAMPILARLGVPLLVHAELESQNAGEPESVHGQQGGGLAGASAAGAVGAQSYQRYLRSRPALWELDAIGLMIRLSRQTGCRTHIVHLSAAEALDELARAKGEGVPITAETCPHYLSLAAEEIQDGATHFKCAPPIRERENQERLWNGLKSGAIDFVVSDHSPCTPALKRLEAGDFDQAWGGIAGLQFSLPVVWTELRRRGVPIEKLAFWMSAQPARFLRFDWRKGSLLPGRDADLVIWDPDAAFVLEAGMVRHRHALTPYLGRALFGRVHKTYVRGRAVYADGQFSPTPHGESIHADEFRSS